MIFFFYFFFFSLLASPYSKLRSILEECQRAVGVGVGDEDDEVGDGGVGGDDGDGGRIRRLKNMSGRRRKMPKALYTIPVGQNPTGGRLPSERYDEIYQVNCLSCFFLLSHPHPLSLSLSLSLLLLLLLFFFFRIVESNHISINHIYPHMNIYIY
jgi:hypothetical protein